VIHEQVAVTMSEPEKPPVPPSTPVIPRAVVYLEEGVLVSMAANEKFREAFPFLKQINLARSTQKTSCCGRKTASDWQALDMAKQQIASLDSERKRQLKQLLNAEQVQVVYRDASGRTIQMTF
jgi:hypothetical protein